LKLHGRIISLEFSPGFHAGQDLSEIREEGYACSVPNFCPAPAMANSVKIREAEPTGGRRRDVLARREKEREGAPPGI
jgi:hypothetical protein